MSKCKGYAAKAARAALAPFEFERREPRENDVVIDIKYCGICHSDIHQARNEWSDYQEECIFPMVPGHEIAGVVTAIGGKATKYKVGDKVGVGCFVDSCRNCEHPLIRLIDFLNWDELNVASDAVLRTEIKHLLCLPDASNL